MIIESIVTTLDRDHQPNFAPMGVEWDDEIIVLKPFLETTTFRNLSAHGAAVVNFTDDVLVFARAALSNPVFPSRPAERVRGVVLDDACSWHEVEVESLDATPPRARAQTRVVHRGRGREFLGFNRARHAVLEAAILSTRIHLLPHQQIEEEMERLAVLVEKTAGPREREGWSLVVNYLRERGVMP